VRFAANISILFKEAPFLDRFGRAKAAGFSAVEFWWPKGEQLDDVAAAASDAGLTVALMNFDAGDMPAGDRGFVGDPERQHLFRNNVPVALELARRLDCRRLNALLGHELSPERREEQLALARENVAWAADEAAAVGAHVLIEAINTFENGPYLVHTTPQAAEFVRSVGRPNVSLQYDVYHMQRMEGNLVATLRDRIGEIAHVQVADSPARGEPGTGEINFAYVLGALEQLGYDGFVGLEYNPTTPTTEDSLRWLPREVRSGGGHVTDLAP
jgi:hydroxypyruvate isomerase